MTTAKVHLTKLVSSADKYAELPQKERMELRRGIELLLKMKGKNASSKPQGESYEERLLRMSREKEYQ